MSTARVAILAWAAGRKLAAAWFRVLLSTAKVYFGLLAHSQDRFYRPPLPPGQAPLRRGMIYTSQHMLERCPIRVCFPFVVCTAAKQSTFLLLTGSSCKPGSVVRTAGGSARPAGRGAHNPAA
eukprot:2331872-Rhodomonas_salina.7